MLNKYFESGLMARIQAIKKASHSIKNVHEIIFTLDSNYVIIVPCCDKI